jgi:DNA-directed RNA polymerase sigma subunit (sigma70/sigma32)
MVQTGRRLGKYSSVQEVADRNIERDRKICTLRANGLTFDALARRFGLSRERVRVIVRQNEQWRARNARVRAKFDGVFTSNQ